MKGWHNESARHSLAARGIKTRLAARGTLTHHLPTDIQRNWWKYRMDEYMKGVRTGEINDPFVQQMYTELGFDIADDFIEEKKKREKEPGYDDEGDDEVHMIDIHGDPTEWFDEWSDEDDEDDDTVYDYYHRLWWYRSDVKDTGIDVKMIAYDTVTDWEVLVYYGDINDVEKLLGDIVRISPGLEDMQSMLRSIKQSKSRGVTGDVMVATTDTENYPEMENIMNLWENLGNNLILTSGSDDYSDMVMKGTLSKAFRGEF